MLSNSTYERKEEFSMKSKTTVLILSVLVGGLGIDRFYPGYAGMGVLKLLTAGCFGILYVIDIVNIATGKLLPADGSAYEDDTKAPPAKLDELAKLAQLHEQGILTDAEFEKMKADRISQM